MSRRMAVGVATLAVAGSNGVTGCADSRGSHRAINRAAAASVGGTSSGAEGARTIAVSDSVCAPGWDVRPGRDRFVVVDRGPRAESVELQQAVSGIAVARASVAPGRAGAVSATLAPGDAYRFSCAAPGESARVSRIVQLAAATSATAATASPAPPPVVSMLGPLDLYIRHEDSLLAALRVQLRGLRRRLAAGSSSGARAAWIQAHLTWLMLGQDDLSYGAFGALGGEIDGDPAGLIGGAHSRSFTGFHRVELDLWRRRSLAAARHDAARLATLVARLTPRAVASDLPATVVGIDAWALRCHEILEDALRDSLSGEDDEGSHTDLVSVRADVSATREMLSLLAALIRPRRPGLVATATDQLGALDRALAATGDHEVAIAGLPQRRRQAIDAATDAALQTLAPVSELMQIGDS